MHPLVSFMCPDRGSRKVYSTCSEEIRKNDFTFHDSSRESPSICSLLMVNLLLVVLQSSSPVNPQCKCPGTPREYSRNSPLRWHQKILSKERSLKISDFRRFVNNKQTGKLFHVSENAPLQPTQVTDIKIISNIPASQRSKKAVKAPRTF